MKPLLLVIDLQNGWQHAATNTAMRRSVQLCQSFSGDIIHCRFRSDPASLFVKQLHWHRFIDPPDTDEIPEVAALKLPTYWRSTYSCLNNETIPVVQAHSHTYIAGVFTDISVAATAMAVFDINQSVSVVTDCVATLHGEPVHRAALKSLEHALGRNHLIPMSKVVAHSSR